MERAIVLCPLRIEARALRRALSGRADVRCIGPGPRRVVTAIEQISAVGHHAPIILAGLAGGLAFGVGVCRSVREVVLPGGSRIACPLHRETHATVAGVDAPVHTSHAKRLLATSTGADMVDCESHAFARAASQARFAFAIVRAVSDGPDDELPPDVDRWVNAAGGTRPLRVLGSAVSGGVGVRTLARLQRHSARALHSIGPEVRCLLDEHEREPPPQARTH